MNMILDNKSTTMDSMSASRQWFTRPDDQRFTSLDELVEFKRNQRDRSAGRVVSSRDLTVAPLEGDDRRKSLVVIGPDGSPVVPNNWSFGQLAARVNAPAGYLRSLPADIAADCLNVGLIKKSADGIGTLLRREDFGVELAAATGPNYGRVWDVDVAAKLQERFGDGVSGDWRVPGEFGVPLVEVTKDNTTLFASDRDMFVFLADETKVIPVKNRRDMPGGSTGAMARGIFVWNSEVGSKTLGMAWFLYDYVCKNRIVWGMQGYNEVTLRHTSGAPDRFIEEIAPAISAYASGSTDSITLAIEAAQNARIKDDVEEFLTAGKRFTRNQAKAIQAVHLAEEGRPIESLWDAATGATALARGLTHQDERVDIERKAGKLIAMAS